MKISLHVICQKIYKLKAVKMVIFISAISTILVGIVCIYVISFHRITTLEDSRAALYVSQLPVVNCSACYDRCRLHMNKMVSCLPNTIFIGASKSGTTSMVHILSQLPHIHFINRRIHRIDKHKEIHRFDRNMFGWTIREIELADELASAPMIALSELEAHAPAVVHYTPHYLYAPTVPFDMRRFYSHARHLKFIVMLRDPVDRAWSSYWFQNSHIFRGVNRGSKEEFLDSFSKEMTQRRKYEECMNKQFPGRNYSGTAYLNYYVDAISRVYGHARCARTVTRSNSSRNSTTTTSEPIRRGYVESDSNLSILAAQLERHTTTCFGSSLRSRSLGNRHTDKSIYADQLVRWFLNFHPSQFVFISLSSFAVSASYTVGALLQFLQVDGHADGPPLHEQKKLTRPNNLSELRENQLLAAERKILADVFVPYNNILKSILCDVDVAI